MEQTSYSIITLTLFFLQGHVITLEITSGQVYRGKLLEGLSRPTPILPPHHKKDADIWML